MTRDQLLTLTRDALIPRNPELSWVLDPQNLLFLHLSGSRLYGTDTAGSDWDIRGVTVAPKSYWVGARTFEQTQAQVPELGLDIAIYDFRRWLHLTVNVNPNVVETLYVPHDSDAVLYMNRDWWPKLVGRIKPLINRRAHAGYHGYATSQLKKMLTKQSNKTGRRELTDEFGLDTKFVMHGFRLARQGAELLRTGHMTFPRPDADNLRAIRDGKVYRDSETAVADWEKEAAVLDAALAQSVLPEKGDFQAQNQLLMDVYDGLASKLPDL
jgi:hypothetical protein